jgi:molybdopterin-guanine dinucleotide biosynthesis protein A
LIRVGDPGSVTKAYIALGRATRLPDKFWLPVEGEPIISRELRVLRGLDLDVAAVSVRDLEHTDLPRLIDRRDAGPLGVVATILETGVNAFLLVGGDMPYLDAEGIRLMLRRFRGRSVVPIGPDGRDEVLHAIYADVATNTVERLLDRGGGLRDLVRELEEGPGVDRIAFGEIDPQSFTDIDTFEDYERWVTSSARPARPSPIK